MPKKSTEAKTLDEDEKKTSKNLTQLNKGTEEQSQQQAESKEQKEQCQLQAETYEENNVSYTESHRHIAKEQELEFAERAREHQVEIEEEIEVEKQTSSRDEKPGAATQNGRHVKKGVTQKQQEGAAINYRSLKKPG